MIGKISKQTALKALADYHRVKPQEKFLAADSSGGIFWCEVTDGVPVLKCRHGDYEFTGSFSQSVFKGDVSAFLVADSSDLSGWTLYGSGFRSQRGRVRRTSATGSYLFSRVRTALE